MTDTVTEKNDYNNMTKTDLILKCYELGVTKCAGGGGLSCGVEDPNLLSCFVDTIDLMIYT
jgi:hypothetical protein